VNLENIFTKTCQTRNPTGELRNLRKRVNMNSLQKWNYISYPRKEKASGRREREERLGGPWGIQTAPPNHTHKQQASVNTR
jgi:hypothetical protein